MHSYLAGLFVAAVAFTGGCLADFNVTPAPSYPATATVSFPLPVHHPLREPTRLHCVEYAADGSCITLMRRG